MESEALFTQNSMETLPCDFHEHFVQKFHNPVFAKSGLPDKNGKIILFSELAACTDGCEVLQKLGYRNRCTCPSHNQRFQLLDKHTGKPQKNVFYRLKSKSGDLIEGKTDKEGLTRKIHSHAAEEVEVSLFNRTESKSVKAAMTPKGDKEPVRVYLKVFWEAEKEWTDTDIASYHHEAQGIAAEIQQTTKHTCDKYALSILIQFASKHKLPIKIKTGAGVFRNVERDDADIEQFESSPNGYSKLAVPHFAAPDMPNNAIALEGISSLQAGDILLKYNHSHDQVIMWANNKEIRIRQGNFPPHGVPPRNWNELRGDVVSVKDKGVGSMKHFITGKQNDDAIPGSPDYLGVPIEDGVYRLETDGQWSFQNLTLKKAKDYITPKEMSDYLQWNFYDFNN